MNRNDVILAADAQALAKEINEDGTGRIARVGFHVTNGVPRYPVYIIGDEAVTVNA